MSWMLQMTAWAIVGVCWLGFCLAVADFFFGKNQPIERRR